MSKEFETKLRTAIQDLADTGRQYRANIKAKYGHFLGWIGEEHKPMEIVIKVLRTFTEEDIVVIGDKQLMELYEKAKIVWKYQDENKKQN